MMDDTLKQTWEIIDNKYIFFMNIGQKENVSKKWDVLTKLFKFNTNFKNMELIKTYGQTPFIISTVMVVSATIVIT